MHKRSINIVIIIIAVVAIVIAGGVAFAKAATRQKPAVSAPKTNVVSDVAVPAAKDSATASEQVPILVYHSIAPKTEKKESKMAKHYHIYPENFEAQMQYLKDNGYTPITFAALSDYYRNGTAVPKKAIVLTFDDGWKNQYTYAYPILKKFGFAATFFVITDYGAGGYPAYLKWDQIRELDKAGMDIESHTVDHKNLAKVDAKELVREVAVSKTKLESELGHPIMGLAYPEYGHNAAAEAAVKSAGYLAARAGWTKVKNGKDSIFALKSQESVNNTNPFSSLEK